MSTILVTGANRGLGFGLVKKLLTHPNPPAVVLATCRDRSASKELLALAEKDKRVRVLQLEVSDVSSFPKFAEEVAAAVGPSGLNVLINMAGIHRHKDKLEDVTEEDYLETYKTNVIGPIFLIKMRRLFTALGVPGNLIVKRSGHQQLPNESITGFKTLLPLIQKAADKNANQPQGMGRAAILNISSLLGSVGANTWGDHYSYRESKAAINTFTRNLSLELKKTGILVLTIHPGWVQTDLGGPEAPLTIDQSVTGLCDVIYNLNEDKNGEFIQWDGQTVPW